MQSNAKKLETTKLSIAHKAEEVKLLMFFTSVNFDKHRIEIVENDFNGETLTLWLQDKFDRPNEITIEVPVDVMAYVIEKNHHNQYMGEKYTQRGRQYQAWVEIDTPISWYDNDATSFGQQCVREDVLEHLLNNLAK